jgi:hypothetical protein
VTTSVRRREAVPTVEKCKRSSLLVSVTGSYEATSSSSVKISLQSNVSRTKGSHLRHHHFPHMLLCSRSLIRNIKTDKMTAIIMLLGLWLLAVVAESFSVRPNRRVHGLSALSCTTRSFYHRTSVRLSDSMDPDDKTDNSATDSTTGSLSTNHHEGHISDFQNHKEQTASRFEAVENRRKEDREDNQRRADQAKDNFNDVIARAIDTTEKRIAASETAYLKVIAANKESIAATEKRIAASETAYLKVIAANKESSDAAIAANKESSDAAIAATKELTAASIASTKELTAASIAATKEFSDRIGRLENKVDLRRELISKAQLIVNALVFLFGIIISPKVGPWRQSAMKHFL